MCYLALPAATPDTMGARQHPGAACDLWLARAVEDPDLAAELEAVRSDPDAVNDRFYRDLAFGTGGLRGVIGAGTNRMNLYTV